MSEPVQVLIVERSASLSGLLAEMLEQANYSVAVVSTDAEALSVLRERKPEVVLSTVSRFDGEALARTLRKLDKTLGIALIYPPTRTDDVEARARMYGADFALVGPVQRATVLSAVRLLLRLRRQGQQLAELESQSAARMEPGDELAPVDLPTFKRVLQMEVKKSRRYRFPAAFLLLQIEPEALRAQGSDAGSLARVVGAVLAALTRALRDVDLCVHAGSGRFIIFLPHTPFEGARTVAGRLHARVRRAGELELPCSVGGAAYDGQGQVSYGSLLRDATLALKRARLAGGDRVEMSESRRRDRVFIA